MKRMQQIRRAWQLYALFAIPLLIIILFRYLPMYGAQIAFRDYRVAKGILASPWVGGKHFLKFFRSNAFGRVVGNTFGISLYALIASIPFPIILALCVNSIRRKGFRKTLQMVTYAPYFISTVVMAGIILQLLAPRTGLITQAIVGITGETNLNIMADSSVFKSVYVWSEVWQKTGFNSIIYIAILSSVDPSLHEAAVVDGASLLQRIRHIDFPALIPTAVILLILNCGQILNIGFEKVLLLQNSLNLQSSEIISTYVYKIGLASSALNFSYPSAIGLFSSAVGLVMIALVNWVASRLGEESLW